MIAISSLPSHLPFRKLKHGSFHTKLCDEVLPVMEAAELERANTGNNKPYTMLA